MAWAVLAAAAVLAWAPGAPAAAAPSYRVGVAQSDLTWHVGGEAQRDRVRFEVDGGYLPGGDQTAELADSLPEHDHDLEVGKDPQAVGDRLDASLFAAMLHP